MNTFELYSGDKNHMLSHCHDICHEKSIKEAKEYFKNVGFWGTCTIIERDEQGNIIQKQTVHLN